MRGISDSFVESLISGRLKFFLKKVKENRELYALAIRENYINIYYRGGNLLKITQKRNGYHLHFDKRYCIGTTQHKLYDELNNAGKYDIDFYINNFYNLQKSMDEWFALHRKKEREFQHKLLHANSCIVDIEYQVRQQIANGEVKSMRFDMLAVQNDKLLVIENKYGNGALTGSAGLSKHYNDICSVLCDEQLRSELLHSVQNIARTKYRLGLTEPIVQIDKAKTEIIFLLANYNKNSRAIQIEVGKMPNRLPAKVLFVDSMYQARLDFFKAKDIFSICE